jgi:hypothetical protein
MTATHASQAGMLRDDWMQSAIVVESYRECRYRKYGEASQRLSAGRGRGGRSRRLPWQAVHPTVNHSHSFTAPNADCLISTAGPGHTPAIAAAIPLERSVMSSSVHAPVCSSMIFLLTTSKLKSSRMVRLPLPGLPPSVKGVAWTSVQGRFESAPLSDFVTRVRLPIVLTYLSRCAAASGSSLGDASQ